MDLLSIGSEIKFVQSGVILKVENHIEDDAVECTVLEAKEKSIFQYDRCLLEHNEDPIETLLERDEKDILWGLEYGVHIVSISACYSAEHIQAAKDFLKEKNN
jgi:pyruvate kinase